MVDQGGDPDRETLTLVPTVQGTSYHKTYDEEYWRAYKFIENAQTYEIVENPDHAHAAAQAFGKFQKQLSDLPPDKLSETIPDFHHTGKRFQNLITAVAEDVANRAASSKSEIDFVQQRADYANRLIVLADRGEIPERITHNDTKFNNVMIDQNDGTGICVIDLDTVMPGLALYDFGDSIRSMANPVDESEQDLSKVQFDMGVFARFTEKFIRNCRKFPHTERNRTPAFFGHSDDF